MNANQPQLYTLIPETLQHCVDNEDVLGSLIGYTVVNGLLSFRPKRWTSTSQKERILKKHSGYIKNEEVKAIHESFIRQIADVKDLGGYESLAKLVGILDPRLEEIISKEMIQNQKSILFKNILNELKAFSGRGSYEETLKRRGWALKNTLSEKGLFYRQQDILLEDHDSIRSSFLSEHREYLYPEERLWQTERKTQQ